jgi:hypothetical protein
VELSKCKEGTEAKSVKQMPERSILWR